MNEYIPGEIIVIFVRKITLNEAREIIESHFELSIIETFPESGLYLIAVTPGKEAECIKLFKKLSIVTYASRNYYTHAKTLH